MGHPWGDAGRNPSAANYGPKPSPPWYSLVPDCVTMLSALPVAMGVPWRWLRLRSPRRQSWVPRQSGFVQPRTLDRSCSRPPRWKPS